MVLQVLFIQSKILDCATFPNTSEIVKEAIGRNFYVDDILILTGAKNLDKQRTLKQGQFDLREWTNGHVVMPDQPKIFRPSFVRQVKTSNS